MKGFLCSSFILLEVVLWIFYRYLEGDTYSIGNHKKRPILYLHRHQRLLIDETIKPYQIQIYSINSYITYCLF